MIQKLHISGFKCFRDLDLPQLGRINLFVGKNNSGKSSILEAVELFASDSIRALFAAVARRRGEFPLLYPVLGNEQSETHLESLLRLAHLIIDMPHKDRTHAAKADKNICMDSGEDLSKLQIGLRPFLANVLDQGLLLDKLSGEQDQAILSELIARLIQDCFTVSRGTNVVRLNTTQGFVEQYLQLDEAHHGLTHPQSRPVRFVTARGLSSQQARGQWDRLSLEGKDEAVLDWMRLIEPELREIRFLREAGSTEQLYLRINGDTGFKPLFAYGDGLTRIFHLALAAADASNGILLIDEFENGLHWSVQKELWRVIREASQKFDIQVFATTHSRDCLQSLAEVQSEQLLGNPAAIYRLERTDDTIYAQILPVDAIQSAMEYAVEVR